MPIEIRPGKQNLARNDDRMEALFQRVQRLLAMTAEYPIDIQKNGDAIHFAWKAMRPCWVVVGTQVDEVYSGHSGGTAQNCPKDGSGGGYPGNHYNGVEATSRIGMSKAEQMTSGLTFNQCFPLLEMAGNTNVPLGSLVYATPSLAGTHYEFVYGTASLPICTDENPVCQSGNDLPCCVRVSEFFQQRDDQCGIIDGCICLVPTGIKFIPDES